MDKLILTTVYVPVEIGPTDPVKFIMTEANKSKFTAMQELPNVYPLTGQQIHDLVFDFQLSSLNNIDEYLKRKGVTI